MKIDPYRTYILDSLGNAVPEPDFRKFGDWCWGAQGMEHRRVAFTQIGEVDVSTVFLGIPHVMVDSDDYALFETMVFGADDIIARLSEMAEQNTQSIMAQVIAAGGGSSIPEIQRRYVTREKALQGHAQMVQFVEVCLARLAEEKL